MTTKIYDQYQTAFNGLSAYAILNKKGVIIGKVAFKRGNCRVTAYTHIYGLEMTKGIANGGGYDMCSAACQNGFNKMSRNNIDKEAGRYLNSICLALQDDGQHWDRALLSIGYNAVSIL